MSGDHGTSDHPHEAVGDRGPSAGERMAAYLLRRSHAMRPDDLPRLAAEAAAEIGARDVTVYVADHEQRWLVPLGAGSWGAERLGIDGTVAGRAFRTDHVVVGDEVVGVGGGSPVWVPLLDGTERIGVLGLSLDEVDDLALRRCELLATLIAELVVSRDAYGDAILHARRLGRMTLAAELRWSQLPPLTTVVPGAAVSGLLEPAYEIAGDAFDFAVNGDEVHLAMFDAMGHGLEASMMATLAVAAYRHRRRQRASLGELQSAIDDAVADHFGAERFVTGQFGVLDTTTGLLSLLSAGHPLPLLLRGTRMVGQLECEPSLPLGLGGGAGEVARVQLEPGDRILFYSDGVVEARSPDGDLFGIERLADLLERAAASELPLPEVTRRLVHSVLEHQQARLQDDATVLVVEWRGADDRDPTAPPPVSR